MKTYSKDEIVKITGELSAKVEQLQAKCEELYSNKKSIHFWNRKKKQEITEQIDKINIEIRFYNDAIIMLYCYEDSLSEDLTGFSDEDIIRLENEAANGDSMSKMLLFCHKCFIEKSITDRDINRMKIEYSNGKTENSHILYAYQKFFEE